MFVHACNICALGKDDVPLQEEASTSIQHKAKRNKKHKHKRKRDGELHASPPPLMHTIV